MDPNSAVFGVVYLLTLLLAPLTALLVQNQVNIWREKRQRKVWIFATLMATRATRLEPRHVEALNGIQVEFYGRGESEKRVMERWKEYLDHLVIPENQRVSPEAWLEKGTDRFIDLLYEMAKCLGYTFDRVEIKKQCYYPVAHGDIELENLAIRKGLVELLDGKRPLKMAVVEFPLDETEAEAQKRLRELSVEWFEGKRAVIIASIHDKEGEKASGGVK